MLDQPISTIDVAKDVGFKVASTIVNTYSLALSTYRGSEDTPATPQSQKEKEKLLNEAAGTIAIYDIVEEKFIYIQVSKTISFDDRSKYKHIHQFPMIL